MKMPDEISLTMLAPCGVNCFVCYVHLRTRKTCPGCLGQDESKPDHCRKCKIRDCAGQRGVAFCSLCPTFPCAALKRLDRSYQQRYQASLIENGVRLAAAGGACFLAEERARWTCADCGGVISLHDGVCSDCGKARAAHEDANEAPPRRQCGDTANGPLPSRLPPSSSARDMGP
jgi:hypothetical protein